MQKNMLSPLWRTIQKENFTNLEKLAEFLQLSLDQKNKLSSFTKFPLNLPKRLAYKIEKKRLDDPIFKQFLPTTEEDLKKDGFVCSPTEDLHFSKTKKLLQKYKRRALFVTTSACVMNCRFCFRQNYPYEKEKKDFKEEIEMIRSDLLLEEVILSGGDPLSLSDKILDQLICELDSISHLKILRFHTRFPIGIPERISEEFLKILSSRRLQIIFVLHTNHPIEIDEDVAFYIKKVQRLGIPVLNHTVLLKGVNDDLETLISLNMKLISCGIMPYYLNQLDKVEGSSHFEVEIEKGKELIQGLRENLPGYGVPRYIREIPGRAHKTPIF